LFSSFFQQQINKTVIKDGLNHTKGRSELADSSPYVNDGQELKLSPNVIASRKPKPVISTPPFFTYFLLTANHAFLFPRLQNIRILMEKQLQR